MKAVHLSATAVSRVSTTTGMGHQLGREIALLSGLFDLRKRTSFAAVPKNPALCQKPTSLRAAGDTQSVLVGLLQRQKRAESPS